MDNDSKHGLKLYEQKPNEDLLFVKLWLELTTSGELNEIVRPDKTTLFDFLELIRQPRIIVYHSNSENEIDYFAMLEAASGVPEEKTVLFGGLWTKPNLRGTRILVQRTVYILERVFERFENCIGSTYNMKTRETYEKFGFHVAGYYESLYNKDDIFTMWLNKKDFYKSRVFKIFGSERKD